MPVTVGNRQLGVAENGRFTTANTAVIPGGRLWPEAALTWNAMRAAYVADGGHPADFVPAGPVSSARPRSAQDHFWANQPPAAARPYTSNHGWGIAVDVKTRQAAAWLMRHGQAYGWSHDEGARVNEWWHFRYIGASAALLRKLARDPLAGYTAAEKRWVREWDTLARQSASATRTQRQRVLDRVMTEQLDRIDRIAKRDGWTRTRRRRAKSLRARIK